MTQAKKPKIETHEIQYIMVSKLDKHWDAITSNSKKSSSFKKDFIDGLICRAPDVQEAVTLFIRRYTDGTPDKSWLGKSFGFERVYRGKSQYTYSIHFKIREIQPIPCPPAFKNYPIGWYQNPYHITANYHLQPPFLEDMATTDDWRLFELYCHYLLKLLGINHLHPFVRGRNKGKGDGQFILQDLYVIYDATLRDDFMETKEDQILNFAHKLKNSRTVSIGDRQFPLKDIKKQIWIITRGDESRKILTSSANKSAIIVKEIPFKKLVMLYYTRLHQEISETALCEQLKSI